MKIFPPFPKFLKQPNCFHGFQHFWKTSNSQNNLYVRVLGILPSAHVRWFEVDENDRHCESRSVWLNHKRQLHLPNLLVPVFEEPVLMLECSYVASSLFFVIFSPFEFISACKKKKKNSMQNLTNSKLFFVMKIISKFHETVKLIWWILNFMKWNGEIKVD